MAANFLFTIISVPLALHYLSKEEFGLWALVLQIGNFLLLLDFGMSSSVARFLANHKDSMNNGEYGSILRTSGRVFAVQAVFLGVLAVVAAFVFPHWLALPANLIFEFQKLVVLQGLMLAAGLSVRAKISPLWAHQRTDLINLATSVSLIASLLTMAAGFSLGWDLDTLWISSFASCFCNNFFQWFACRQLCLFPPPANMGCFQKDLFFRMIYMGRDLLLIQLGGLLCQGSQMVVVTKVLGLEMAALFSVVTKSLIMGQQLIGKFLESAVPGLTEMFVRGEKKKLADRFFKITILSAVFATFGGVAIASLNSDLVSIWTNGKMNWDLFGNFLLGGFLILSATSRCLQSAFGITAQLHKIRFLSLTEGTLFILLALFLAPMGGLHGVLLIGLLCHFLITFLGYARQTYFLFSYQRVWVHLLFWIFLIYIFCCFYIKWWLKSENGIIGNSFWALSSIILSASFIFIVLRMYGENLSISRFKAVQNS